MTQTTIQVLKEKRGEQLDALAQVQGRLAVLVDACARNKEHDPEQVWEVCDELFIEPEEVLALVEQRAKRLAAAAILADAPKATARAAEVEREMTLVDERYAAAIKKAQAERDFRATELRNELTSLLAKQDQSLSAETTLRHSFDSDPKNAPILAREKSLSARGIQLAKQIARLDLQLSPGGHDEAGAPTLANVAGAARGRVSQYKSEPGRHDRAAIAAAIADADNLARQVAEVERQKAGLVREKQKVDDELQKLSALRLIP